MKKTFFLWIIAMFLLVSQTLEAQQAPTELKVKASGIFYDGRVILRWVPADYDTWQWCNRFGYRVERVTTEVNGQGLSFLEQLETRIILDKAIVPFPEEEWQPIADVFPIAAIGASALYSPEFTVQAGSNQTEYMTAYNKVLEKENRYNFFLFAADQEKDVARAAGLFYQDNEINTAAKYKYTIIPNKPDEVKCKISAGYVNIDPTVEYVVPEIEGVEGLGGDKKATVKWSRLNLDKFYSSFNIERADRIDGEYRKLNTDPVVPMASGDNDPSMYYADVLPENKRPYYYRVIGKSPYGFYSSPTKPIEIIGRPNPVAASPAIYKVKELNKGKLTVNWTFPPELLSKIKSYSIFRAEELEGKYELLVDNVATNVEAFEDINVEKAAYYYIVRAIDENDYELNSFPALGQLKDDEPPVPPAGLKCSADKTGLVTITWDANQEIDLMGYRVFYANNPEAQFTQITETHTRNTTYNDQLPLNVLNELIYYKVLAVDYHQNYSELSEVCTMLRPDVIPPSEPTLKQAEAAQNGVLLAWVTSRSKDLARHELQRKASFESQWVVLGTFPKGSTIESYVDSTAQKDYVYSYRVLAFDKSQNLSSSNIMQVIPIRDPASSTGGNSGTGGNTGGNTGGGTTIKGTLTANPYFTPDYIELSWDYTISTGNEYFAIYRSDSQNSTTQFLDKVSAANVGTKNLFNYQDLKVQQGLTYYYEVQLCGVQKNCISFAQAQLDYTTKAANNTNSSVTMSAYILKKPVSSVNFNWTHYPKTGTEYMEVYRSLSGTGKSTLVGTVNMTGKNYNWTFADNGLSAGSYDYEFRLCDGQVVTCPSLSQKMGIEYNGLEVSIIKSKSPNFIELQWFYDTPLLAGQEFSVERIDASGVATNIGTVSTSNLSNGEYKLKDITAQIGAKYQYTINLCGGKGNCITIYSNIVPQY